MSQSYIELFDEIEVLEENKLQTILKGSKKNAPDQLVLINKFKKISDFKEAFKELLSNSLQHNLHIDENDNEIILVSEYLEGENLSLYLNFADVSENDRVEFVFEYLHQAIAYIAFDNSMINILLNQNQIIFINKKLYLKEYIIFNRQVYNNIDFSIVSQKIGQTIERILTTNFKELKTSDKLDKISEFAESLMKREHKYHSINDIYEGFKNIYFDNNESHILSNGILVGEFHPNNMFFDSLPENKKAPQKEIIKDTSPKKIPIKKENKISYEVTEEERAILTRPTEKNIDLNKLSNNISSIEDLFIDSIELEVTEIVRKHDTGNYGIPDNMKTSTFGKTPSKSKKQESLKIKNKSIPIKKEIENKKPISYKKPIYLTFFAILVIISLVLFFKYLNAPEIESKIPVATFEIEAGINEFYCINNSESFNDTTIVESYWNVESPNGNKRDITADNRSNLNATDLKEGKYIVNLIVTDSNNRKSNSFKQEFYYDPPKTQGLGTEVVINNTVDTESNNIEEVNESLNNYSLDASTNVSDDFEIKTEGNKSIKIDLTKNDGNATLSFSNISIKDNSIITFALMPSTLDPISIRLVGYKDGKNIFSEQSVHEHKSIDTWDTISTKINTISEADRLVITFESIDSIIWIDQLEVNTF